MRGNCIGWANTDLTPIFHSPLKESTVAQRRMARENNRPEEFFQAVYWFLSFQKFSLQHQSYSMRVFEKGNNIEKTFWSWKGDLKDDFLSCAGGCSHFQWENGEKWEPFFLHHRKFLSMDGYLLENTYNLLWLKLFHVIDLNPTL